jgi:hypothetical protein
MGDEINSTPRMTKLADISISVRLPYSELWPVLVQTFISLSLMFQYPQFDISCRKLLRKLSVFKRLGLNERSNFWRQQSLWYKLTSFPPLPAPSAFLFHVSRFSNSHFTKLEKMRLCDLLFWCKLKLLKHCTVLIITIQCCPLPASC